MASLFLFVLFPSRDVVGQGEHHIKKWVFSRVVKYFE